MLGAHFLPYGWLVRSPARTAPGPGSGVVACALQVALGKRANVAIAPAMAVLHLAASAHVLAGNRRVGVSTAATP